ncbi:MAG: DUF1552 domain-containing protein [Opitutus sp.]|nr:DUF1552 domain-containing protein [Opitutus sp.]
MKTKSLTPFSQAPYVSTRVPLSRRHFLRVAGVALSLPMLEVMSPRWARGQASSSPLDPAAKPRRMLGIINNLGYLVQNYFPTGAGRDYKPSEYLELIKEHRNDFTVFSGVHLPSVQGSHPTQVAWLTGAPNPASSGFRNTISLDQVVADNMGTLTRFPSLSLAVNTRSWSLSFTGSGVAVPPEDKAAEVFKQLFVQGSQSEIEEKVMELENGRSILDRLTGQLKNLERGLGAPDRERMDQFLSSVRTLEGRLQASEGWERKPKPVVKRPVPVDPQNPSQLFEKIKVMYDIATLVLQTDSSRAVTLFIDAAGTPAVSGQFGVPITEGYHGISHHGKMPDKLAQHQALDREHFKAFNGLLAGLKSAAEDGESLLDRTNVLWGTNLSDANAHLSNNLPFILAGGGWKHGQHLGFDPERPYPLTNVYLSVLHRMGISRDKFSSSTGTCRGLEMT